MQVLPQTRVLGYLDTSEQTENTRVWFGSSPWEGKRGKICLNTWSTKTITQDCKRYRVGWRSILCPVPSTTYRPPSLAFSLDYLRLGDGIRKGDNENILLILQWLEPLSQAPWPQWFWTRRADIFVPFSILTLIHFHFLSWKPACRGAADPGL